MNYENLLIALLTILLPLIGGAIGYLYKQGIDKKKELQSEVNRERRDIYQQFVNLIIDIFSETKIGKEVQNEEILSKFFEFYKKYILYASPDVINSFAEYLQSVYNQEQNKDTSFSIRMLSTIMLKMRKDLGLSNSSLGKDGEKLFRALITDFDKVFK